MATKAGVWIDHKQAIVVLITDAGQQIKKFTSGGKTAVGAGGPRSKQKYTPNDFIAEDRRERKLAGERQKVYDEVLACIRGAKALLILGPGEAKSEFSKHIQSKKLRGLAVELLPSDKLTDRQLAAQVSKHFAPAPAGKSATLKKTAKAVAGKRTKKTGK